MKSIILIIAIVAGCILWATSGCAQVSIQAGAGIAYRQTPTLAGHLSVSYKYQKIEGAFNMLSLPFRKPTYLGINGGYILGSGDWQIKPYAGVNYKLTGTNYDKDTHVHNGVVTMLSSGGEVNKWVGSFGMQLMKGAGYFDLGYMDGWNVSVGMRYTFKN